ncbi:MAG TPA: putative sulfate exporter family transporter [Terracidiphilus sp.]|nr:putative sulfate exporter family transporter [Terracidiphilus sp.]
MPTSTKKAARTQISSSAGAPPPQPRMTEDWLAVCIGLFVFLVSLALLFRVDLLGWATTISVWTVPGKSLAPASAAYAKVPHLISLLGTFAFLLVVLAFGARALRISVGRFVQKFTVIFALSYVCWWLGSWAYIAATPDKRHALGVGWSLNLTNESGYIIALLAGLVVANFLPGVTGWMQEALRPELYIKSAIVLLGGFLGITALSQQRLASTIVMQGVCAIVCAYLIFWPVVYYVARRWFGFSREWAAPLASGISICGVSAAIATGSAIRARPVVPVMVSSLVVVFSVVEILVLPFVAGHYLYSQPLVAGAWMSLAVKTDGAAVASGAIADSLVHARALGAGLQFQPGWTLGVATTVKVFIDIFIGVWAFVLAWVWSAKIERRNEQVRARQIWERFPKFILGYVATFLLVLILGALFPDLVPRIKSAMGEANIFRTLFFVLTFFAIGAVSNFRRLWQEGIAKLAGVYVLCLFGFIIWVGLLISWLFFHGVLPPTVKG